MKRVHVLPMLAALLVGVVPMRGGEPARAGIDSGAGTATAIFAGGCFWCMEKPYEELKGVKKVISGFTGGKVKNPTYEQVTTGNTGHREVVQVTYDPATISYAKLLEVFWPNVDPFDDGGQFCDRGHQYTAAIYAATPEEKRMAEESKAQIEKKLGKKVVTPIAEAAEFYAAEDDHQDYYKEHATKYRYYRWRCGRDERLEKVWGKPGKNGA